MRSVGAARHAHITTDCAAVKHLRDTPINAPSDAAAAAMALMNGADVEMGSQTVTSLRGQNASQS